MAKILFTLAFLLVASLALVQAQSAVCDPDGNGLPTCTAANNGQIFRNNWDPTRYWQCSGTTAESVPCPSETGFDPTTKTCISWSVWEWQPPCPTSS